MSSKRGRKRNDNLPPNRARDVQRAFRARRAAHLEALEQRVAELEEENNTLRAALSLPPANRPPLGKGPTGKDKPKQSASPPTASSSALPPIHSLTHMSPTMSLSRTESPSEASTRTQSLSPESMGVTLAQPSSSHPPGIDSDSWNDMYMSKEQSNPQSSLSTSSYTSSTSASYPPSSSSRPMMSDVYMHSPTQNYPHSADRPMTTDSYAGSGYVGDRRTYSSYSHPSSFQANAAQTQAYPHTMSSMMSPPSSSVPAQPPLTYSHRRSITDPQGIRTILGPAHGMRLPQHAHRLPTPPELNSDSAHPVYDMSDRRLDRMN